tara:strand:- start:16798 stop:17511 length:714 start_codon:yes stop_codon:yes gene_type:complete
MIKFFRHIRQNLIMENNMGKYFKYAIGEIVLVVIGILIALSINNWNEKKKLRKEETKLLITLQNEIEANLETNAQTISSNDTIFNQSSRFLKKNKPNEKYDYNIGEIISALGYNTNKFDTSILNEILGTNSRALISDDKLLHQLRELKRAYDNSNKTQFYVDEFWNNKVTDFFTKSGLGIYIANIKIDTNYDLNLELNKEFFALLGIMNGYQRSLKYSREDLKQTLNETLVLIKSKI